MFCTVGITERPYTESPYLYELFKFFSFCFVTFIEKGMLALAGVQYRCLENLFSFSVRENRRLVRVDYKLVIRVSSYGSFKVVALPRNVLLHFAVGILAF